MTPVVCVCVCVCLCVSDRTPELPCYTIGKILIAGSQLRGENYLSLDKAGEHPISLDTSDSIVSTLSAYHKLRDCSCLQVI